MGSLSINSAILKSEVLASVKNQLVWLALLRNMDENCQVRFSLKRMADKTEMSERVVKGALNALHNAGLIVCVEVNERMRGVVVLGVKAEKDEVESAVPPPKPAVPEIDFERFRIFFNKVVDGTKIPTINLIGDKRKKAVTERLKDCLGDKHTLNAVLKKVIDSDFLTGRKTDWHCTFDWIFKRENFQKIIEGNYDNTGSGNKQQGGVSAGLKDRAREVLRNAVDARDTQDD